MARPLSAHFVALALIELEVEIAIGQLAHTPGNLLDGARQSPADHHRQYDADDQCRYSRKQDHIERRGRHGRARGSERVLARLH